jgi:hypothetical protein
MRAFTSWPGRLWNYCLTTSVWLLYDVVLSKNNRRIEGGEMKNPLDSLWGTVISGLVITVILYNIVKFVLQ